MLLWHTFNTNRRLEEDFHEKEQRDTITNDEELLGVDMDISDSDSRLAIKIFRGKRRDTHHYSLQ